MAQRGLPRDRSTSVFINCPRDEAFRPLYEAIVLACVHAGFFPVIAESSGQSGRPRLARILNELAGCRYSIHDLSRSRGEGDANLARFNMPLELGMAMAIQEFHDARDHEYLILVPEDGTYQRFISDLAGLDPRAHDGSPGRMVGQVLSWLLPMPSAPAQVSPQEVFAKLPAFTDALRELRDRWLGAEEPWPEVVRVAIAVVRGPAPP